MTPAVQNFIEENIELIETANWKDLFFNWYTSYAPLSRSTDINLLREFFLVCKDAGISVEEESYQVRKDLVQFCMEVIIRDLFDNDPDLERIAVVRVINELKSRLYLSLTELFPLYREAVDATGHKLAEDSLAIVRR